MHCGQGRHDFRAHPRAAPSFPARACREREREREREHAQRLTHTDHETATSTHSHALGSLTHHERQRKPSTQPSSRFTTNQKPLRASSARVRDRATQACVCPRQSHASLPVSETEPRKLAWRRSSVCPRQSHASLLRQSHASLPASVDLPGSGKHQRVGITARACPGRATIVSHCPTEIQWICDGDLLDRGAQSWLKGPLSKLKANPIKFESRPYQICFQFLMGISKQGVAMLP